MVRSLVSWSLRGSAAAVSCVVRAIGESVLRTRLWNLIASAFIVLYAAGVCYGLTPQEHVAQAKTFLEKKEYDNAVRTLTACVEAYPEDARCYGLRGTVFSLKGRYREALVDFDRSIQLLPGDPGAYLGRGAVHLSLKEYDKAIQDFTTVITSGDGLLAVGYFMRGDAYRATSQRDRAIADYTGAIEADPRNHTYYLLRAELYYAKGRRQDFLRDCRKVYELNPRIEPENFCLKTSARKGLAHLVVAEPTRMLSSFNRTIDGAPKRAIGYYLRGTYYLRFGLYKRAAADLSKASELEPGDYDILTAQGDLFSRQGLYDKAIKIFERAVDLKPGEIDATENLSFCYKKKGDYQKAQDILSRAVLIEPENPFLLSDQAELSLLKGSEEDSARSFERALAIFSGETDKGNADAETYAGASWAALLSSKFADAGKYAQSALSLDPLDYPAHAALGHAFLFQNKKTDAFEEYRIFIERGENEAFTGNIEELKGSFALLLRRYPERRSLLEWAQRQLWVQ